MGYLTETNIPYDYSGIKWTHFFEEVPSWAVKCIVLKEGKGLRAGKVKILDVIGTKPYWIHKKYLVEI